MYNLYFHPLAAYPGPFLARATHLWRDASLLRGRAHFDVQRAHQKYGNVVRIAPDELSYTKPDVWKDVFGHRPGKGEVPKSRDFYDANAAGSDSVFGAYHTRHGELRRLLSHGFSEKALRAQETIIQGYADLLIKRLYEHGNQGQTPLDVGPWFNVCFR